MNYNEIVNDLTTNFQHPCDAEVPAGYYRRVMWEKYNTDLSVRGPAVNEEWTTEVIPLDKRVYDKSPFNAKSDPLPVSKVIDPNTGEEKDPSTTCTGLWSAKIGYCFASLAELQKYVKDIGSTLQSDNNWFGADLSKKSLFKHPRELEMYRLENTGATWSVSGPRVDTRLCMRYDANTMSASAIDFNATRNDRSAYLKHYEDKPCTFVGMRINTNVDTSIPPVPSSIKTAVAALPIVITAACLPMTFGFPYNNLSASILKSWNKTRQDFKLYWDSIPGLTQGAGDRIATMYDDLSISMQELGQSVLGLSQYALQLAWAEFTKIISTAMNIVGGAWDMIKSFLPSISILGVKVDILELCTDPQGVQKLKEKLPSGESVINAIYRVIGSSYDYGIEYIKIKSRDIVDALTDLYDWAWANLQYAGVAMCKLLGELAQIWSMPPEVPNPVWLAIKAVREIFSQVKPLDLIMSGNFPGFTASELYTLCMNRINEERKAVLDKVESVQEQMTDTYEKIQRARKEYTDKLLHFDQYLNYMWENVTEQATERYQQELKILKEYKEALEKQYELLTKDRGSLMDSISNVFKMGLDYLKQLPIMSTVNELLGMAGASIDSLINVVQNAETGLESLYEDFVEGCRNLKDVCKTLYNQCCTLAMSKVTQWVDKLLSVLSLVINFPGMSFCTPMISY